MSSDNIDLLEAAHRLACDLGADDLARAVEDVLDRWWVAQRAAAELCGGIPPSE